MASSIRLTYLPPLLLALLVLTSLFESSTSNPTKKLTPELIERVCLASGNPTCLQTLQHDPQTLTLNLVNLTTSYVEKARTLASTGLLLIGNLVGKTLERELIFKYRNCWTHYKVAVTDLSRAKRRLNSGIFTGIAGLASTAMTRASACDDEFEDRKFARSPELDNTNRDLRAVGGIVFGLAAELVLL